MKTPAYYSYLEVRPLTNSHGHRDKRVSASKNIRPANLRTIDGNSLGHYGWVKSRDLEQRSGDHRHDGLHLTTGFRVWRRFGIPSGDFVLPGIDPKTWPEDIDLSASLNRIHHYHRLVDYEEAIKFLRWTRKSQTGLSVPINVDVEVNEAWFDPPLGQVPVTPAADSIKNVHSFAITGYDLDPDHPSTFVFQNSWGEDWGDKGFGYLTKEAFSRYVLSCWTMEGVSYLPPIENASGICCLLWKAIPEGQNVRGVHGREIVDSDSGQRIAWAFARSGSRFLELEEFVVWPSHRRKGYGRKLAALIHELAEEVGKPIRAWIPYADAEPENEWGLKAAMNLLGLHLHSSEHRCASFLAMKESPNASVNCFLPPRATSIRDALRPTFGVGDNTDAGSVISVWFATNRRPIDKSDLSLGFGATRDETTRYGSVNVAIPKCHRFGSIGSSWLHRWLTWTEDRLSILERKTQEHDRFWESLKEELSLANGDSLVFIHGYNVDFDEAAIRAAQIASDLKIAGETAFFSWPSKGTLTGYAIDEATIQASEPAIAQFLMEFATRVKPRRVHVIAHSMGNRGFIRALQRIVSDATKKSDRPFGQLILAAADLDADLFVSLSFLYGKMGERTTLYASPADKAIGLSDKLHGYPRVGLTPPITVVDGVDTIVVPAFDLMSLGHGYFAEAEGVLHDIFDLIRFGAHPEERQRLSAAQTSNGAKYWKMLL